MYTSAEAVCASPSFQSFNFLPALGGAISAAGFVSPTPIQERAIPAVMDGRDVMGLAQTGTGKTAAFVLPVLQRLAAGRKGRPRALIIAPTRELAEQIHSVTMQFSKPVGLRCVAIYGGVSEHRQIQALRRGVEVVIGCPGRVLDLVQRRALNLSELEVVVLDEADHMFDMGFLPSIRQLLKAIPVDRQTLLFSATMPPEVRELARQILRDPVTVEVGQLAPVGTVEHALYPVSPNQKTELLIALLHHIDRQSVLVFTRTKHRAKKVSEQLKQAGFQTASLQGNLSQGRRRAAMDGFRSGAVQILVATDIAARGVDISTVSHVINYDMPDTTEAYTHRVGRTGRASRNGDAFTLVTSEDQFMVRAIERVMGEKLERRNLPDFNYGDVPAARDVAGSTINRQPQIPRLERSRRQPGRFQRRSPSSRGGRPRWGRDRREAR